MASSSSSSPSAVAFSSQMWKYHVFISFRGEDSRKNFVDFLYAALVHQGIYVFRDDQTLPRGESINSSLMNAIENSQIAIVVFSRNYANSSRCLDELVHIMKCKDTRGQIVIPIFYDVDPSEVRKQKHKYGEAFVRHVLEDNKKVESWRKALVDASNLSGWEIEHISRGNEAQFIKEIVTTIFWKLDLPDQTSEDLIGMDDRVEDLESKLQIGLGGVRMIGIVGVGGGGKTALANSIYDKIRWRFDGCCFIENILETSRSDYGLEKLQEQILLDVLKEKQKQVWSVGSVDEGKSMIRRSLCNKKVLIVLDDVNHLDHLQALAGSHDWFGEGSRILITTRDENLLTVHRVGVIHNITLLNKVEAIQLFCKHGHHDNRPVEDYERSIKYVVSIEVVSYAGGLPLALEVLGHFLFDKDINKWRSALATLILMPDQKSHVHDLVQDMAPYIFSGEQNDVKVAAHMKNRRSIDLNIEQRVEASRPLPENLPRWVQKQRKYRKEDLVDAIIKPLFPDEDLIILQHEAHFKLKIPLQEIILATNNFSEQHFITSGGFGKVYRGQYEDGDVAIKKLDIMHGQGRPQFQMEITLLSAYKHENLVSLVGFCEEDGEKILVYKYERNGSLNNHLHKKDLKWIQRIQICLDAARGLKYLHDDIGKQHRILHRDIKSANILLDENFRAKISDFGLSKIALANVPFTLLISNCAGTPGYCDPEYFRRGQLTQYSDVYSFGVVMFEVLCGKLGVVLKLSEEPSLAEIAQVHYENGTLDEIIDSGLRNQMNLDSLRTFSAIAYQCLKCPANQRPRMAGIVKELEKALGYQEVVSQN